MFNRFENSISSSCPKVPLISPLKVYVSVLVDFRFDGVMIPRVVTWENGNKYEVDKILDIRIAAAMRAGGYGDRYTVLINGQMCFLFFERCADRDGTGNVGRWFVERRV